MPCSRFRRWLLYFLKKMRNTSGQSTKAETGRGIFWPPSGGVDKFLSIGNSIAGDVLSTVGAGDEALKIL
jgi:hypothetical protein